MFRQADGTFIQFSREGLEFAAVEGKFCELLAFSVQSSDTNSIDQRQSLLFGNPCPAFSCPQEDELMANQRECCMLESSKFNVTMTSFLF